MKNNIFTTLKIKETCEKKLGLKFRTGKELNAKMTERGEFIRVTLPKGRKILPPKTYKSIANQLRLNTDQFDLLLGCPFKREDFLKNLEDLS